MAAFWLEEKLLFRDPAEEFVLPDEYEPDDRPDEEEDGEDEEEEERLPLE